MPTLKNNGAFDEQEKLIKKDLSVLLNKINKYCNLSITLSFQNTLNGFLCFFEELKNKTFLTLNFVITDLGVEYSEYRIDNIHEYLDNGKWWLVKIEAMVLNAYYTLHKKRQDEFERIKKLSEPFYVKSELEKICEQLIFSEITKPEFRGLNVKFGYHEEDKTIFYAYFTHLCFKHLTSDIFLSFEFVCKDKISYQQCDSRYYVGDKAEWKLNSVQNIVNFTVFLQNALSIAKKEKLKTPLEEQTLEVKERDLSYGGVVNLIDGDVKRGKTFIIHWVEEFQEQNEKIAKIEKNLKDEKFEQESLFLAIKHVARHLGKELPLTVTSNDSIIFISDNNIGINKNMI